MRKALIYIGLLASALVSCSRTEGGMDAESVPDSIAVVAPVKPGVDVQHVKGAFLKPLQERDSVLVADQLMYGFYLKGVEEGTQLALPGIPEKQDYSLRFIGGWEIDTLKAADGKLDLKGSVKITSFEEGLYVLPPISVLRMSPLGAVDTLKFDALQLDVRTMPVDTAAFRPHSIKEQIQYPVTFKETIPWIALGLLVLLIITAAVILIVFLIRRRRKSDPAHAYKDPAHIVALRKLDDYRSSGMWAPERQKAFYSGVTDVLREYISRRYGFGAMEMTTAEIFSEMKSADVPEALLEDTKDLFERADFVKFAKFTASDEDNAKAVPTAVRFVTETYQAEIEAEKGGA